MQYYSLRHQSPEVDFKTATLQGQAPDKGLYFPSSIPRFKKDFISGIEKLSREEIAFEIMKPYVGNCIAEVDLFQIIKETINFPIPLVRVTDRVFSLELFHGPTLAFKDIGARFMSRCLGHFMKGSHKKLTILVATSGDTGAAVANGFYDVEGVDVVILYPSGKVSSVQEKQLTTLGKNIHALEVKGNFDDCQQMVKQAFTDEELNHSLLLSSANSINIARWLPQQFYYLFAYQQWEDKAHPPVISVPSGNFGNICAGLLAQTAGLPVKHFIAACNANDTVPRYMQAQTYQPQKAIATISNAMDVADPSNFVRILEIFAKENTSLKAMVSSTSITDTDTRDTIQELYTSKSYCLDPHGAVAYKALIDYLATHPTDKGIFLETAAPVKFYDVVEPVIGQPVPIPAAIEAVIHKEKISKLITAEFEELKKFLLGL